VSKIDSSSWSNLKLMYLVYRVNWLKAKARVDRWTEELFLVKNEMQWTMLWFQNQANLWRERSEMEGDDLPMGHEAYAVKQKKLWNEFLTKSSERFKLFIN
jgi:hypothetical protein